MKCDKTEENWLGARINTAHNGWWCSCLRLDQTRHRHNTHTHTALVDLNCKTQTIFSQSMIVGTFKFEANAWLGWSNLYLVKLFARVRSNGGRAKLVSMLLSTAQHEVRLKFLRLVSICSCWWITVRIHVLGPNNVCLHSSHHKTILQYIFCLSFDAAGGCMLVATAGGMKANIISWPTLLWAMLLCSH